MVTTILLGLLNSGFLDHGISVHARSQSDQVIVRSPIVSIVTRAHHAGKFVDALSGLPPKKGEGVLMADQTAVDVHADRDYSAPDSSDRGY